MGPPEQAVTISFEGQPLKAFTGDSLAAALIDAGIRSCRQAAEDDLRGLFCGMGVCYECALVVDDVPGRLACMTTVSDGMAVRRQPAGAFLLDSIAKLPEEEIVTQVLVIGAGPAGLTAAAEAAEAGADVVLIDERSKLGGQFFKQPPVPRDIEESTIDDQFAEGRRLIDRVKRSGARIILGASVWGAFSTAELYAAGWEKRYVLRSKRLIVSAGAYERGVPVPGWTLPGVMTTGAAQTLTRSQQISPGSRVLVAGNGPLNLQVAAELADAGVNVVALVEAADTRWWANIRWGLSALLAGPRLVKRGLSYRRRLASRGVPTCHRSIVTGFTGKGSVERAFVSPLAPDGLPVPGVTHEFKVDAVCMGYGFVPSSEIPRSLGCRHVFDSRRGTLVVERDDSGRTSIPEVWVVGDAGAVNGAYVAMAQGVVAAAAVMADLGGSVPPPRVAEAKADRAANTRFQIALSHIYSARVLTHHLADDSTVVCRCETVTLGEIEAAMDDGIGSAGAVKRFTRAGMGKCQGRYCGPVMTALAAERFGRKQDEFSGFAPRPPIRPVPVEHAAMGWRTAAESKGEMDG